MTNPLEWIAATSSHHGGSSDPGGLTLTTAAALQESNGATSRAYGLEDDRRNVQVAAESHPPPMSRPPWTRR
jgi:hypothetical protein